MIRSIHFYDLLDCLAGQFFSTKSALCTGKEFGIQISLAAQDFFSVAIIPQDLPDSRVVLGVLSNDSAKIVSRNGYTFAIYIDLKKIDGPAFKILSSIILSHEICHFAYYYELFIRLGGTTGIRVQTNFTYQVSDRLIDAVIEENDSTSETNIDEHNIEELVNTFGKYDKNHFAKGSGTLIDYYSFFHDFLNQLHYNDMLQEFKEQIKRR
jgi:hypothetical protein